jgi:hypothetical protein
MPKPGDFGLVAIAGPPGWLIQVGQALNGDGWGPFQHAVLMISDTELIEAEPGGARIRPVEAYDGTNITWSDWSLSNSDRGHIAIEGRAFEGVGYSALDYDALALHRLGIPAPGLRRYIASTGHVICSQLVDATLTNAGFNVFGDGRWPGYVTPMALRRVLHGPLLA